MYDWLAGLEHGRLGEELGYDDGNGVTAIA
jgi:hypothetical protein